MLPSQDIPQVPAPRWNGETLAALLQDWSRAVAGIRRRPWLAYGLAVLLTVIAAVARFWLEGSLPPGFPFLTFFPAIVLSVFLGGRGPGALCSVLSVLAAWYWFVPPAGSFALTSQSALAVGFFVLVAVVDVLVIDLMSRSLAALEAEQAQTARLLAQRTTMFQELQHRVANNMTTASMRMAVLQRRLSHVPEAAEALAAERHSFDSLSRLHRLLHDPSLLDRPWSATLRLVVGEFMRTQDEQRFRVEIDIPDDVRLDFDEGVSLSLLVLEALTNSLKHAFPKDGSTGRMWVAMRSLADGRLELTVSDDGVGMATGGAHSEATRLGTGLGRQILNGLAVSLGARIGWQQREGGGTSVMVTFQR